MNLAVHTFGKSRAAEVLVDVLNDYNCPITTRRVTRFLVNHNNILKHIDTISDKHVRRALLNLVQQNIGTDRRLQIKNDERSIVMFTKIRNYALNVAHAAVKVRLTQLTR